jgi:hypothetical protein
VEDIIINISAVIAILLPIFNVYAAIKLFNLSRRYPEIIALKDRWQASFFLAISSVAGGLLGISRLSSIATGESLFPGFTGLAIILVVVLAPSIPNILWVIREKRHHFDGPNSTRKDI